MSEQDLMRAVDRRGARSSRRAQEGREGRKAARRAHARPPRRRAPATACRPSRSSPNRSTASTESSANRRSSSRFPMSPSASASPPTRSRNGLHEQFRAYRGRCRTIAGTCSSGFGSSTPPRKVVGVGSVGTRAYIVLLQGRDQQDPLFLQVKEASASVLEDHLPKSRYAQPGERVVQGQRLMQAASDIFLGWTKGAQDTAIFYWRQLRDMKGSVVVEEMAPEALCSTAPLRPHVGAGARPVGRSGRDRRVPRQEGSVRPVDHRLLGALRRSERP